MSVPAERTASGAVPVANVVRGRVDDHAIVPRSGADGVQLLTPELDLIRAKNTHKLHVGAKAEERVDGDLRAEFLPAHSMTAEISALHEHNEVGIADVHHRAGDVTHTRQYDRPLHDAWNAHTRPERLMRSQSGPPGVSNELLSSEVALVTTVTAVGRPCGESS